MFKKSIIQNEVLKKNYKQYDQTTDILKRCLKCGKIGQQLYFWTKKNVVYLSLLSSLMFMLCELGLSHMNKSYVSY